MFKEQTNLQLVEPTCYWFNLLVAPRSSARQPVSIFCAMLLNRPALAATNARASHQRKLCHGGFRTSYWICSSESKKTTHAWVLAPARKLTSLNQLYAPNSLPSRRQNWSMMFTNIQRNSFDKDTCTGVYLIILMAGKRKVFNITIKRDDCFVEIL